MIGKLLGLTALIAVAACGQGVQPTTQAVPTMAAPSHPNVVRLAAEATSCRKRTQGTGFVYAPERVMTVAHLVAGSTGPVQVQGPDGRRHEGTVVIFDPDREVAVLRVPGLSAEPLHFGPIERGRRATFAGYPKDRDLVVRSGDVGRATLAATQDIYNERDVLREVLIVQASVDPGVAGAPLFRPDGTVSGMVFAADTGEPGRGYALTAKMISYLAEKGRAATAAVSTRKCV